MPGTKLKACGTIENAQRLQDIIIVVERLAHAHQYDIGNVVDRLAARESCCMPGSRTEFAGKVEYLSHDLTCAQVAIEAHLAGSTKGTAKGTTGLAGDAYGRSCTTLA